MCVNHIFVSNISIVFLRLERTSFRHLEHRREKAECYLANAARAILDRESQAKVFVVEVGRTITIVQDGRVLPVEPSSQLARLLIAR